METVCERGPRISGRRTGGVPREGPLAERVYDGLVEPAKTAALNHAHFAHDAMLIDEQCRHDIALLFCPHRGIGIERLHAMRDREAGVGIRTATGCA